jgi:hypothetical protein
VALRAFAEQREDCGLVDGWHLERSCRLEGMVEGWNYKTWALSLGGQFGTEQDGHFHRNTQDKSFLQFEEGDILIIEVKPSSEEIFLLKDENGQNSESIYVRNLSSSIKLEGRELAKFIRENYRKQITSNSKLFIAEDSNFLEK